MVKRSQSDTPRTRDCTNSALLRAIYGRVGASRELHSVLNQLRAAENELKAEIGTP